MIVRLSKEGITLKRKTSKTNIALAVLALTLAVSLYGILILPSIYHPSYAIYANKLDNKPSIYFVLNSPDKYVLEAITNQHSSVFYSLNETQLDEVTGNYGTNAVEYNGVYYETAIIFGDKFPPFMLPQILLAGIVVSTIAIAVVSSFKIAKYVRTQKRN